jgi:fluoride ion exporter CrcB/FEX
MKKIDYLTYFAIGIFGSMGALTRFNTKLYMIEGFKYIVIVNVFGAFLIGFFRESHFNDNIKKLIIVGFIASLTTFSGIFPYLYGENFITVLYRVTILCVLGISSVYLGDIIGKRSTIWK